MSSHSYEVFLFDTIIYHILYDSLTYEGKEGETVRRERRAGGTEERVNNEEYSSTGGLV